MNWVRSKVRQAALLALFALAVQLGLSFGHFHADGLAHAATLSAQTAVSQSDAAGPLSGSHPDGLAADCCGICASIVLAGTLLAASAPTLPAPAAFALWVDTATVDFTLPELTRAAFRSRAPPRS